MRRKSEHKDRVWSYDFLTDRTEDGRQLRLLAVIDETTRECLAIEVGRSFTAQDVIGVLQYLFAVRGTPQHIRSDNGPKFVAKAVCRWLEKADVKTLFVAKGSPWENGYVESAGGKLRDELLNREIFLSLDEVRWVMDRWRLDYNHHRIHTALGYQTPAAYADGCVLPALATPAPPEDSRILVGDLGWHENREPVFPRFPPPSLGGHLDDIRIASTHLVFPGDTITVGWIYLRGGLQ